MQSSHLRKPSELVPQSQSVNDEQGEFGRTWCLPEKRSLCATSVLCSDVQ